METSESPVCHPFLAQSQQATEDQEGPSNSRDAAAINKREAATSSSQKHQQKSSGKLGQSASSDSVNLDAGVSKQEQGDGRRTSHLVTETTLSTPSTLCKSSSISSDGNKLVEICLELLHREKNEKDDVQSRLRTKEQMVERFQKQKEDLEDYLRDMRENNRQLEEKVHHMQQKLDQEQQISKDIVTQEKKIECLKSDILEKDRELRQEKEDMQARILVLEEQLEKANKNLEIQRHTMEVEMIRRETEGVERVLEFMEEKLKGLRSEIDQLNQSRCPRKHVYHFLIASGAVLVLAIRFFR